MARRPLNKSNHNNKRYSLEELEDRILFSADLAPVIAPDYQKTAVSMIDSDLEDLIYGQNKSVDTLNASAEFINHELVFVDTNVDDYKLFLDDLFSNKDPLREMTVVMLDSQLDGISQISNTLSQYTDIDAVHFVSHGNDSGIQLGTSWLSLETLGEYREEISDWQDSLTLEADILIYGCELASSESGQTLLNTLGDITGADIAANDDLTGNEALGGDWDLEFQYGDIETGIGFGESIQASWNSILATPVVDLDYDDSLALGVNSFAIFNGSPVNVADTDAILSDADSVNLASLTVTIVDPYNGPNEILTADTSGTSISSSYVSNVLTLSGSDSVGNYQKVLRTIQYNNTSADDLDLTTRHITFVASDGVEDSNIAVGEVGIKTDYYTQSV